MSSPLTVSSAPIVRATLATLFTAALSGHGLAGGEITVVQGELAKDESETVQLGSAKGRQDASTMGGPTSGYRSEAYDIEVLIRAYKQMKTQLEASERAFEIFGYLDAAVRADSTLGLQGDTGFQYMNAEVGNFEDQLIPSERGYQAEITWYVEITAAI